MPEIWTASMHRPVDCRKLDALARNVIRLAITYHTMFNSRADHTSAHDALTRAIGEYKKAVYDQLLSDEDLG